ncbi:hypothetical protein DI273_13520 [Streptomyces violascens]|nr:hypothetical protein DI273_13520 [Streptomyces violascens]
MALRRLLGDLPSAGAHRPEDAHFVGAHRDQAQVVVQVESVDVHPVRSGSGCSGCPASRPPPVNTSVDIL